MKRKKATGAVGYVLLFALLLVLVILTMFLAESAKLMTYQHEVDDALTDAVLASLVADDPYYFETMERDGRPVVRFRDHEEAWQNYRDCMQDAMDRRSDFYRNFTLTRFTEYEVEGDRVTITQYAGNNGTRSTSCGRLGEVKTEDGETVRETSACARVDFLLLSVLDGSYLPKSRHSYCTLEINTDH